MTTKQKTFWRKTSINDDSHLQWGHGYVSHRIRAREGYYYRERYDDNLRQTFPGFSSDQTCWATQKSNDDYISPNAITFLVTVSSEKGNYFRCEQLTAQNLKCSIISLNRKFCFTCFAIGYSTWHLTNQIMHNRNICALG